MQTPPHEPPMITHISTKGQVVIPRALREEFGLHSGMPMSVQKINGGIMLRPAKQTPHPITRLFGIFHRPGEKPLSVKGMDRLIMKHVQQLDDASKTPSRRKGAKAAKKSTRKRRP
jgi:AbrB family looped-hinge helix DNA binding protein